MPQIIQVDKVKKSFGNSRALDGISFSVEQGEIFGLLGPNGSGKSTLIKILSSIQDYDSGTIKVFGKDFDSNKKEAKKAISVIPQEYSFFEDFTVGQNLEFFGSQVGLSGKNLKENTESLLVWLGLKQFEKKKSAVLSGGYKRLLNIGISLLSMPKLLLMDEPTVGLDPQMRNKVWKVIGELNQAGMTIMLTTHYMEEAQALCKKICLVNRGKLVALDTPQRLIDKFANESVLVFVLNKELPNPVFRQLKGQFRISEVQFNANSLIFRVPKNDAPKIAGLMALFFEAKGFEIVKQSVKEPDLEHVFISLTGEELKK